MNPSRLLTFGLFALLVFVAACDSDSPTLLAPGHAPDSPGVIGEFNPQPDPPKPQERYRYSIDNPELIDNPDLRPWVGEIVGPHGDALGLTVQTLRPPVDRGGILELDQVWRWMDGDVERAVQVSGVLNLTNGQMVLNGGGPLVRGVHVRGSLIVLDGTTTLGGELMFNPQPDPPADPDPPSIGF